MERFGKRVYVQSEQHCYEKRSSNTLQETKRSERLVLMQYLNNILEIWNSQVRKSS